MAKRRVVSPEQTFLDFSEQITLLGENTPIAVTDSSLHDKAIWLLANYLAIPEAHIYTALDFLAHHSDDTPAYIKFYRPKKSGGKREIRAPKEPLKSLCRRIYLDILMFYPLNQFLHGFRPRRTIVTNGTVHLNSGANHLGNWDITDFFPSTPITLIHRAYERTLGKTLRAQGLNMAIIDELMEILSHISTLRYGRAQSEVLPMGSPTSPCLANHVLLDFDANLARNLNRITEKNGQLFTYSRYGDDLTVSSPQDLPNSVMGIIPSLLDSCGYSVKRSKTRICHRNRNGYPLEVTGLIIGEDRLLIKDKTLSKYELALMRLIPQDELTEKEQRTIRGILGITKMVYGTDLAPRIAHCLDTLSTQYGRDFVYSRCFGSHKKAKKNRVAAEHNEPDDRVPEVVQPAEDFAYFDFDESYGLELVPDNLPQARVGYTTFQEIDQELAELDETLDPSPTSDNFRHPNNLNN